MEGYNVSCSRQQICRNCLQSRQKHVTWRWPAVVPGGAITPFSCTGWLHFTSIQVKSSHHAQNARWRSGSWRKAGISRFSFSAAQLSEMKGHPSVRKKQTVGD
jgi:hypothetical protein